MEEKSIMFDDKHPLSLIDLWSEQLQRDEDSEKEEENDDVLIAKQYFRCSCFRCNEEINWYHRYYYSCCQCSNFSIHKFCAELPKRLEDVCVVGHTLDLTQDWGWKCNVCDRFHKRTELCYDCRLCYFKVDVNCVTTRLQKNIIHHPSHKHPLVCIPKQILAMCDACGKEHKGIFYHCPMCVSFRSNFIHSHCASLPQKLQIQHTTNNVFSHIHPLTLAYSFPKKDQISKNWPRCRVCVTDFKGFVKENLWIYKCEKCRYYTHLDCATSRTPGTGKTIKNYEDDEHPDLLHLPFPDPSYSILKHLFFKKDGLEVTKTHDISHQHPLILEDVTSPTSSRISYHDPMKRIELLCDGCVRPIMSGPIYVCANKEEEHCNFVLHEWCSRLPTELKDHFHHPQHTLFLHSKAPDNYFFGVFTCNICRLEGNGFVYCCMDCNNYIIDVNCAFLPKEITHTSHPNHLLSRKFNVNQGYNGKCDMCYWDIDNFSFDCHTCNDFHLHPQCALLIPETTMNKCDKHPMKLSYFPIENHKSDYFCEVCEMELNPERAFYHCRECMQSMHPACAPSILRYETYTTREGYLYDESNAIHKYVNVKFGGTYKNIKVHPHPLSFLQGIANDGRCSSHYCYYYGGLQYHMIFKCLTCEFVLHYYCCERMSN